MWQASPLGGDQSTVVVSLRAIHLMRHTDGETSLHELSDRLELPLETILDAARELFRHKLIKRVSAPMVGRDFLVALNRAAVDIMGPMGEIVIEDALFELGLGQEAVPEQALPELIDELKNQFRDRELRQRFQERVDTLRTRYGLAH